MYVPAVTTAAGDDNETQTLDDGYRQLRDRVLQYMKRMREWEISDDSEIGADDRYLNPIYQSFRQIVSISLASALDHLRLAAESLIAQPEPNPFAHSTLIRSSITTASTALWLLVDDPVERRLRALECIYKDYGSYLVFIGNIRTEPRFAEDASAQTGIDEEVATLNGYRNWTVDEALKLRPALTPNDFKSGAKEHKIVKESGSILQSKAYDGWDSGVQLLKHYQILSGYAHGKQWQTIPDQTAGEVLPNGFTSVTFSADPNLLLEAAFMALSVIEAAFRRFEALST